MKYTEINILDKDYSTITFDQLSKHLNLDEDLVNSDNLESILKASIDWVEQRTNNYITPTEIEYNSFDFTGEKIDLEHKGFSAISSFKVNDVDFTDYKILRKYSTTHIIFNQSIIDLSTIAITYTAGETPANNLIQAALINAADMYDVDRSNYSTGLVNNRTVMRLLNLE